ncbi:MAG: hypothetical protein AB7V46_10755 [Thermomicrobiales bacterium]
MLKAALSFSGMCLAFAASPATAQGTAQIFAGTNGEIEATFPNNCVVYYDASGRRKGANKNCSRSQVNQADTGVAAYRREQGMDGYPGDEAPPGGFGRPGSHHYGAPEVVMDRHGRSHVLVGSSCIVYYDRGGARDGTNDHCSHSDRSKADAAMQSYRREQGKTQNHPSGYSYGIPVLQLRNGNYQATVSGTCTVYFNNRGGLMSALPGCTTGEKANAAIAVLQYRRGS